MKDRDDLPDIAGLEHFFHHGNGAQERHFSAATLDGLRGEDDGAERRGVVCDYDSKRRACASAGVEQNPAYALKLKLTPRLYIF